MSTGGTVMADARFRAEQLRDISRAILSALGLSEGVAEEVARSLVLSNLVGHDSHGIVRLPEYSHQVRTGQIKIDAAQSVVRRAAGIAVVDGGWGFGQPAAQLATRIAIETARSAGVGLVTIRACNHVGRLGEYVAAIALAGQLGLMFCNAGAVVAPFGGRGRVMGTNPFAWAVPRARGAPVALDFATAAVAEGKLRLARADGRPAGPGWIVDARGRPSTNPEDFYAGGALLPFGTHKGSGMSMMIELSAGLLSGMGASCLPGYGGGNGALLMAADIEPFMAPADFSRQVEAFCEEVKRRASPEDGREVLVPGEVEARTEADREAHGVPVSRAVRRQLTRLADDLKVDVGGFADRG
jgi:uncharacterized oxidoreductase